MPQLLATIDDRESVAGVQRAQAQVQQAQAELANAQAQLDRTRDLQGKGFVSKSALDTAETQYQAAPGGAGASHRRCHAVGIGPKLHQSNGTFDGWVMQTLADTGDLAVPGKPLRWWRPQPLRVVVQVPASRSDALLSAGMFRFWWMAQRARCVPCSPWRTVIPSTDPVAQTVGGVLTWQPKTRRTWCRASRFVWVWPVRRCTDRNSPATPGYTDQAVLPGN